MGIPKGFRNVRGDRHNQSADWFRNDNFRYVILEEEGDFGEKSPVNFTKNIAIFLYMCYIFKVKGIKYTLFIYKGAFSYGISGKYPQCSHHRPR